MPLLLIEHPSPQHFRDAVFEHLLENEAECCGHLGLIQRMADRGYTPISSEELDSPLLLNVQENNRVEAVGIQTLKKMLIVTRGSPEAMQCIAKFLADRNWTGEMILGPSPSIDPLVERYAALSGRPRKLIIRLRVFQLTTVTRPRPVPGSMRLCTPSDRNLLAQFITGFISDIGEPSGEDTLAIADRLLDSRRIFFWVDQNPVAMAAWAGPTPNGIRVNFVYTRPEFRGHGYASNLVADLSQRMLNEGRKFCFLFTDQANPTSNSIYQKLGYLPVSDSERWEFGKASAQ